MFYTINVLGRTYTIKSKVGAALAEQYAIRFADDPGYVFDNVDRLQGLDTASCLLRWFELDEEGRRVFALQLRMPLDKLEQTCEGIKWIANN